MRIVGFISLISLAVIALAACGEPRSERQGGDRPGSGREQERPIVAAEGSCGQKQITTGAVDELTRRQVLDRLAAALTCPGKVAHVTARVEHGGDSENGTIEYWMDMENATLRFQSNYDLTYAPVAIANEQGIFRRYGADERSEKSEHSPICSNHTETLLSYLFDEECFLLGYGERTSVDAGEYDGRDAVVLRSEGLFPYGPDEDDGIVEFDTRVYFDPETFVVLGATVEGTLEGQSLANEKSSAQFELEFVPLDSLGADFFDPASIGYVQPVAEIDELDGTLYWLGDTLPASDGFSELTIDDVWSPERAVEPGDYIGIIYYEHDVALHEYDAANMSQESREYFEDLFLVLDECIAETIEVDLGDGRGVIWGEGREAADGTCGPATHYVGRAFFEETIVTVITSENTGAEFDSAEGMERVLRGLKRRD